MKFNLFKLQNFSWVSYTSFYWQIIFLFSILFISACLVLLGSDRACLNTSISCWGNSTTHIRVIERSQMLSPSIISLETADYFLLNWLIWLLLLQCICTVLIKPKNQNIPKENISVIEKIMMYIFFPLHPNHPTPAWATLADLRWLSITGQFTDAAKRKCFRKINDNPPFRNKVSFEHFFSIFLFDVYNELQLLANTIIPLHHGGPSAISTKPLFHYEA